MMKRYIYIYIALAVIGIVLPVINFPAGAIYGAFAFVGLAGVQLSLLSSSGGWAIFGGRPTLEIQGIRKIVSICAVVILVSVLCGFLAKLVWF